MYEKTKCSCLMVQRYTKKPIRRNFFNESAKSLSERHRKASDDGFYLNFKPML